jgi:glycosyltransferase involved in cell wall biosynthesis
MKILVLTDRYPPFYEGAYELNCHQVTEGLRARGHTVVVLTTTFGVATRTVDGHVHRTLHFLNLRYRGMLHRRWMQLRLFFRTRQNYRMARRLAEEINPDLAFVWNAEAVSILPILAMQDLGIPTVFRVGSHWLVHRWNEYVKEPNRIKRWYRASLIGFRQFEELEFDAAIVVSETLKQSYRQAGFNVENAVVIPSGIPSEWIAQQTPSHQSPNGPIRLLYVGRLEAEKGPDVAVRAVEHLIKVQGYRNVCLDLVGNGRPEYIEALKQLITTSNLQNIVRLTGFLPRLELIQRYSDYDVLLFPTPRWEGLPMTVIEAMAQGLIVIASDIGGPRDIIENGRNGFLVTPNEPIELADAIGKIIETPSLASEVSLAAIRTVRQKCTFDRMLDHYEAFLESCTPTNI